MIMTQDAEITLNSAFTHEEYEMMLMLGKGKFGEGFEDKAVTMQKFVECQASNPFDFDLMLLVALHRW